MYGGGILSLNPLLLDAANCTLANFGLIAEVQ